MQTLYIPQGIKDNTEIFNGFGKKELGQTVIFGGVGILISVLIYSFTRNLAMCMVMILICFAVGGGLFIKSTNMSLFEWGMGVLEFIKGQKYYPYRYLSEWEGLSELELPPDESDKKKHEDDN